MPGPSSCDFAYADPALFLRQDEVRARAYLVAVPRLRGSSRRDRWRAAGTRRRAPGRADIVDGVAGIGELVADRRQHGSELDALRRFLDSALAQGR